MKVLVVIAIILLLVACGEDAARATPTHGSEGWTTGSALGSVANWILIAGGAALALATAGLGILACGPISWVIGWIPGVRAILVGVEIIGGSCVLVGSALDWLDRHPWAHFFVFALVGALVVYRNRKFLMRWLRVEPKAQPVTSAGESHA